MELNLIELLKPALAYNLRDDESDDDVLAVKVDDIDTFPINFSGSPKSRKPPSGM